MFRKKGQSTLEYAFIISVVVAALVAINAYMKRGVEGRLKDASDNIGQGFVGDGEYTYAWRTTSNGNSLTTETKNRTLGTTNTYISTAEEITRNQTVRSGETATTTTVNHVIDW